MWITSRKNRLDDLLFNDFLQINTRDHEIGYSELLRELLDAHKNVVTMLAEGFRECRKHIHVSLVFWKNNKQN